jgi:tRNA (guanine-N7-)-methyltransferase
LIFALAAAFKDQLVMGMEIRGKVVNFVGEKIRALRSETNYTQYMNASVVRTNTMKHLVQVKSE